MDTSQLCAIDSSEGKKETRPGLSVDLGSCGVLTVLNGRKENLRVCVKVEI